MEANTRDIVRLAWARHLGLPDEALTTADPRAEPIRLDSETTAMAVRLFGHVVLMGPGWWHDRAAEQEVRAWTQPGALLRWCDGHPARLVGESVLACTDSYVQVAGLTEVPVSDDPELIGALERACPPDDVTEVGLSRMFQALVVLDEDDSPVAGAGYAEWQGLLGRLGVLTPLALRRSGHGATAASLAVNDALDTGLVPQCRVRVDSAARRLSHRLGLTEVGSQTTVQLT